MSFNGSGTFAPYTPGNPVTTGAVISSTAFNATMTDLAAGLTNTITRDGQSPPTANLPMAARKLTGLGAGTVAGDSVRFEQLPTLASLGAAAAGPLATSGITGAQPAGSYAASGANSDITSLSGLTTGVSGLGLGDKIKPITASVAANALTVTVNPTTLDFRSATLTSGAVNTRTLAAATSVVVPSAATLGTISAVQSRIVVLLLDNAGTLETAVVNIAGGNDLSETGVISTTAISAAADSASVIYSTTARTNVAYRVLGYVESTQATAGTWATSPSTIQGQGGQALAAMSSLGYGQRWQSVTRTSGTTYYNTTGKPIYALPALNAAVTLANIVVVINGVTLPTLNFSAGSQNWDVVYPVIIPPGASYSFTFTGTTASCFELR